MNLILTVFFILAASFFLKFVSKKFRIPSVILLILFGLILGIPFFEKLFISNNEKAILILGNLGLFCLMFLAGMETSWRLLYKEKKDATIIAFFACLIPFFLGLIVFLLLGLSLLTSIVIGACLSITAEATTARILISFKKLKTKVGSAMIGTGIIDDLIGLILFAGASFLSGVEIKESLMTFGIIASFFSGILFHKLIKQKSFLSVTENLLFLVVPFFFVSMGLQFSFKSLTFNPLFLSLIILIAIVGKVGGTLLAKPFTSFSFKQLFLIGWAMNSRGAMELGLATIAYRQGILTLNIYSGLIVMALVTTIIFPFIVSRTLKRNPKIMDF